MSSSERLAEFPPEPEGWKWSLKFLGLRHISYAEFYITNHCNLTCSGCNRFNNHNISGSANWKTYRDTYRKWSLEVTIDRIAFLGGEPLLHPNLHEMILDVSQWWYESEIEITTNGLLIDKIKPHLQQSIIENSVTMYVSIHNEIWLEKIKTSIVEKFGNLELVDSQRTATPGGYDVFKSESGNKIVLEYTYYFRPAALHYDNEQGKYKLHNSNPKEAHSICDMKHSFHFWKGCLYKCGVMVTLPYMIEQKSKLLQISDRQKNLLNQYQPITLDNVRTSADALFNYIPQCEFCPSSYPESRKKIFTE